MALVGSKQPKLCFEVLVLCRGPDVQNLPVSQPASLRHTSGAQDGGHKGSPHRGHPKPPTKAREAATCKPNNVRGGKKKIE